MKRNYAVLAACLGLTMLCRPAKSQTKAVLFEGIIVTGYVDNGGYLNCTGPSIKMTKKPYTLYLGLLPSLKIKEDKVAPGATKNSVLTPFLGFGFTAAFITWLCSYRCIIPTKLQRKMVNGKWVLA